MKLFKQFLLVFFISVILFTIFCSLSHILIMPIDYLIKSGNIFGPKVPLGILIILFGICAGVIAVYNE